MIDYGAPPAANEIEVTLFGPGYGEAIAVHLGDGTWLLVDSCIDPNSNEPASKTYLEQFNVATDQVCTIVASHWHDDHVRGISHLAATYPDADFVFSSAFNNEHASAFLAAYSGTSSLGLARGAKELYAATQAREVIYPVHHKSIVTETILNGRQVLVTALSPVPAVYSQFIAHLAQYLPGNDQAINHAPEFSPNFESVVLHIDVGEDAILLGADLEDHHTFGWTAVVNDSWSSNRKTASVFKVAHHGSYTGDCPDVWDKLLKGQPVACLTPFIKGRHRLPTEDDKQRIRGKASEIYISSGASRRPDMDSRQLKRLGDICKKLALVDTGFGAVRLRKKINDQSWNVELFGGAQRL